MPSEKYDISITTPILADITHFALAEDFGTPVPRIWKIVH
jgi:hypothetical protein